MEFDSLSILFIWTAIGIYVLAFIAYAFDLARRSELTADARLARERALVGGGSSSTLERPTPKKPRLILARIGTAMTVLGWLFHLAGTVLRGMAAERVPWANLYEFAMTGTLLVILVYLVTLFWLDLRFLGTFILGLVIVLLGLATLEFYVAVVPLMDPLKSIWLVVHVFVASFSVAVFALACALSIVQLMQSRRETRIAANADKKGPKFLGGLPDSTTLENYAYRFAIVGFIMWTFTLIAGSIWAQDAWGRYWGFDVKETWTFIIWVIYAGYIHARATRGWRGNRSAWLSIIGFVSVVFNFTIVNVFFKGLHAYSGL